MGVTHGLLVVDVHLTPRGENDGLRRRQLRELHRQLVRWVNPLYASISGEGAKRPAVVLGDFNESDCIFDDRCAPERAGGFIQIFRRGFLGGPWVNATEAVDEDSWDHTFTKTLAVSEGHRVDVDFLHHDVYYVDATPTG